MYYDKYKSIFKIVNICECHIFHCLCHNPMDKLLYLFIFVLCYLVLVNLVAIMYIKKLIKLLEA